MIDTHDCGGTVLCGGMGDCRHYYCDRCGAFTHDMEAAALPTGTNEAANGAANDAGKVSSPNKMRGVGGKAYKA